MRIFDCEFDCRRFGTAIKPSRYNNYYSIVYRYFCFCPLKKRTLAKIASKKDSRYFGVSASAFAGQKTKTFPIAYSSKHVRNRKCLALRIKMARYAGTATFSFGGFCSFGGGGGAFVGAPKISGPPRSSSLGSPWATLSTNPYARA